MEQPPSGHVSSVRFGIKPNDSIPNQYDVYMLIEEGDILPGPTQYTSTQQVTIVVPTGSIVGGSNGDEWKYRAQVKSNEPRYGAYSGATKVVTRSNVPSPWANTGSMITPCPALSAEDIYSFVCSPSMSWWPDAKQGDTILMFSLNIQLPSGTSQGVRMWRNNTIKGKKVSGGDPISATPGLNGRDFNNGIGIGSPAQIYNGNFNP